ncbi:MAG: ADP-dependent glucokinase/phosphofructokinase [Asgard group archaeon]|nr:ADP-dependent glucokinase/phosphofructokinase [Asgard group archaeon]
MLVSWEQLYQRSLQSILPSLEKIRGVFVGFNTNIDAIFQLSPAFFEKQINDLALSETTLQQAIHNWKGTIEDLSDFVTGICGCFKEGKASEWIIKDEHVYEKLLLQLPLEIATFKMGGQAGIMANLLAQMDLQKIITHCVSLNKQQLSLFSKSNSIVVPLENQNKELLLLPPHEIKATEESPYYHLIFELRKNNHLQISSDTCWTCPRENRFIATYDPKNASLTLLDGFRNHVSEIAQITDAFFIAGFHLLAQQSMEKIHQKIHQINDLLLQAKESNHQLIIHWEMSSTKNPLILDQLLKTTEKNHIWTSLGCNERELKELLEALGFTKLCSSFHLLESILQGILHIVDHLALARFHLHTYGYYLEVVKKPHTLLAEQIRDSLCFSSVITAIRAAKGNLPPKKELLDFGISLIRSFSPSKPYRQMKNLLENSTEIQTTSEKGIFETKDYSIIIIPTILVSSPKFTVGLGDAISSSALVAELASKYG